MNLHSLHQKKKHVLNSFVFILLSIVIIIGLVPTVERMLGQKTLRIAQAATPWFSCSDPVYASSLLCKGEHPRLYLTQATLPYFRDKIATDWQTEMQTFVNHVDGGWSGYPTSVSANELNDRIFPLPQKLDYLV